MVFVIEIPAHYRKMQILFVAFVYVNDIIATRLKFVAKCKSLIEQKIEVTRENALWREIDKRDVIFLC